MWPRVLKLYFVAIAPNYYMSAGPYIAFLGGMVNKSDISSMQPTWEYLNVRTTKTIKGPVTITLRSDYGNGLTSRQ